MKKDQLGLPLDPYKGEYSHPEPRASNRVDWTKPQSFLKLREAETIMMGVPGGWEEVSLPDDYSQYTGKQKPKVLHVMWRGSRVQASLSALRIPKVQKQKKGGSWFHG